MITQLRNPLTKEYYDLKSFVLGDTFPWFRIKNDLDDFSFYNHVLLDRPEMSGYSRVVSQHLPEFMGVLTDIINHNGIRVNYLLRASVNAIEPLITNPVVSVDHVDHEFPHQNLIIYLTDAGGATHCEGYTHDPCEDDIIQFKGMHCHDLPLNKRRVVFVATYA